jgi:hypothetical protein
MIDTLYPVCLCLSTSVIRRVPARFTEVNAQRIVGNLCAWNWDSLPPHFKPSALLPSEFMAVTVITVLHGVLL